MWFSGEKVFTVEPPLNLQNDNVCASRNEKETHCTLTQTFAVHAINFLQIRYGFYCCVENDYDEVDLVLTGAPQ